MLNRLWTSRVFIVLCILLITILGLLHFNRDKYEVITVFEFQENLSVINEPVAVDFMNFEALTYTRFHDVEVVELMVDGDEFRFSMMSVYALHYYETMNNKYLIVQGFEGSGILYNVLHVLDLETGKVDSGSYNYDSKILEIEFDDNLKVYSKDYVTEELTYEGTLQLRPISINK